MNTRTLGVMLAMVTLPLTACVSLPQSGSVQPGPRQDQENQSGAPFDYNPPGPSRGDTPVDVVGGFLQAMQATPQTTTVAREFLTDEASTGWVPTKSTLIYGSGDLSYLGRSVTMSFGDTVDLNGRGEWLGNLHGNRGVEYRLTVVNQQGEWRISNPPDALIVPRSHFETRFQQYYLYFFDKAAQILVPEPVYLPRGEQAPTLLIEGLLKGPDQELLGATRTFIPSQTELEISVPVARDGIAEVPLSDEVLDLDDDDLELALAQIGWTLRQVPGIEQMRITVDGSPLDIPDQGVEQDVRAWPEYDPSINWASQELFGIRDGRVVTRLAGEEVRIAGLFGTEPSGLRTIGVDLPAEQIAGVSKDGTTVFVSPRARDVGEVPDVGSADVAYPHGTDVLRPAWDIYGQVWLIDRSRDGAALFVVRDGVSRRVEAPGITGKNIKGFILSRDGTRLVAIVDGKNRDRLVISRIARDDEGQVRRVAPAVDLPIGDFEVDEIRDLAWRTPGSVALLAGPTPGLSQVIVTLVDGSSALGDVASNTEIFRDDADRIVTSPAVGAPLYVGTTNGQLFELAANGRWIGTSINSGLVSPTFVG